MPTLRKIFFYIFAAIYLVVCPLLILRLMGFVYNPQRHQFVKTGIIYVSTNPPGAQVFINENLANETTPTMIRDLTPNDYKVILKLKGYQNWDNIIPVVARKATVLENILLTPPQWLIRPLSPIHFEHIQAVGDESALLMWNKQTIKDLYLLRLNKASSEDNSVQIDSSLVSKLLPEEFIYSEGQIINFFTVPKSPFFIIHILMETKDKYLWIDARDKQIHVEDISDLIPMEPAKLWWEANEEKIIYVYYPTQTNRIDIKAKAIFPDIAAKEIPLSKKSSFKLMNFKGTIGDENKNSLLIFTPTKIGMWDNSQKSLRWLFQKGHNISQAFWANNASNVLFKDNNEVFLLDKEMFGTNRIQKITNIRSDTSFFYNEKTGRIYFIEPQESLLASVQILRQIPLTPQVIADKLRLKEVNHAF